MKIAVAGTGYVGLVSGVSFAHIGHNVTCVDVDEKKVELMKKGKSPIYESGLEELMVKNKERLDYTTDYKSAYANADVIFIAVGTPEKDDGSADLSYVYDVCEQIAQSIIKDTVVVIKSTVPVGTNDKIASFFKEKMAKKNINVAVVSNPEFLAQGTAVRDTLYAPRIVIGVEDEWAEKIMDNLYAPFLKEPYNQVLLKMDKRVSAEMTKYASNNFLALKISFVNEIANLCEKLGANIEDVTKGMGLDPRIGDKFLRAGIGYGGSCFPKDTKALHHLSKEFDSELSLVRDTIEINKRQKVKLFYQAYNDFNGNLEDKKVAILGVTFKPGTDDLREAPSIDNVKLLLNHGVDITVFDPVGLDNFKKIFGDKVKYEDSVESAILDKDIVFIMTEWPEIINFPLENYSKLMKTPIIYDGRNCYNINEAKKIKRLQYKSVGRKFIK